MIVVYSARCMACSHKHLHRTLTHYAMENKVKYEVRRTNLSKQFEEEALQYGLKLPFVVVDGEAKRIEDL